MGGFCPHGCAEPQSVCSHSSQMVVWLPRSALPRAVTRYGLSGGCEAEDLSGVGLWVKASF